MIVTVYLIVDKERRYKYIINNVNWQIGKLKITKEN